MATGRGITSVCVCEVVQGRNGSTVCVSTQVCVCVSVSQYYWSHEYTHDIPHDWNHLLAYCNHEIQVINDA